MSKYHSRPTKYGGVAYRSKKEAQYAQELDLRVKVGEVKFWLRQVPFDLPGNVRYFCDFVVFKASGSVEFIDVKGYKTQLYKTKKKIVEALYPVTIEEV